MAKKEETKVEASEEIKKFTDGLKTFLDMCSGLEVIENYPAYATNAINGIQTALDVKIVAQHMPRVVPLTPEELQMKKQQQEQMEKQMKAMAEANKEKK